MWMEQGEQGREWEEILTWGWEADAAERWGWGMDTINILGFTLRWNMIEEYWAQEWQESTFNWKEHVEETMYIKLLALCLMNIIVLLNTVLRVLYIKLLMNILNEYYFSYRNNIPSWRYYLDRVIMDLAVQSSPWAWDMLIYGQQACLPPASFPLHSFIHSLISPLPLSCLTSLLSALSLCLCSLALFSHPSILLHFPALTLRKRGTKKGFKKLATRKWDRQKLTGAVSIPHCQGRGKQRPQAGWWCLLALPMLTQNR